MNNSFKVYEEAYRLNICTFTGTTYSSLLKASMADMRLQPDTGSKCSNTLSAVTAHSSEQTDKKILQ